MIIYFSGTGNCLSIARQLSEKTGQSIMSIYEAAQTDLTQEEVVGLVYPSYYFNPPAVVSELVPHLSISPNAYTFIVVPCGAQTGNSIWNISRILKSKGISLDYCHKVRVPDCSAIGFGRNPNDQQWKFAKFASRVETIASDINARRRRHHYGSWGPAGWICALPAVKRKTLPLLQPEVNTDKCIGCETCVRVCPQKNIVMTDQPAHTPTATPHATAQIGNKCVQCLSCVHFCPQQAIEINGKPTNKQHQYHHPLIRLKDMLRD